jgi:hypothetical protein
MYFSHLMLCDHLTLRSVEEREREIDTLINMGFGNSVVFSPERIAKLASLSRRSFEEYKEPINHEICEERRPQRP